MPAMFLQAPGPNIAFGTTPSGATYISDPNGLVVVTNAGVNDELYLLGAGCVALVPGGFGQNALQTGTAYTVQLSDNAQEIVGTNAGAFTLNLPKAMPPGFYVNATQGGAGTVSANALSGASLAGAHHDTAAQYLQIKCVVIANPDGASATWAVMRVGS